MKTLAWHKEGTLLIFAWDPREQEKCPLSGVALFGAHVTNYRVKHLVSIICLFAAMIISTHSWARPLKGFNTGPYLYLEGGIVQSDFDKDQQTGIKVGSDFEPAVGLTFGWNIWDWFSAELEGRYSTARTQDKREHLVAANVYGKYFFILDALTDFKSLRIMPTAKAGFSFHVASLPGNPNSTDTAVTTFGWGPSFGVGLSFLMAKYLFFGFDVKEDLLFLDDVHQNLTINGAATPHAIIYKGGFHPQFTAMGFIGVHY